MNKLKHTFLKFNIFVVRFVCDQCKFAIDLTRLEHGVAKADTHLVDMAIGKLYLRGL